MAFFQLVDSSKIKNENNNAENAEFSYNKKNEYLGYFSGIESHNSIQFDAQQPMYKISRFLWGNWLSGTFKNTEITKNPSQICFETEYKFRNGS